MKNRLPKRLSAWLLTLIMLVGMLPAMASADEVDDDLGPPAPQGENYGYVRLVFSEGEQIDLYHGEYITECSPTAAVHDGADEDFLTDGDYLALYYEGKLYCKAALDGVSIDADAVLPVEDFALVPMGDDPTTLSEEREDETPPAVEVVAPEDESSGSDETVGTPPSTEPTPPALPESKEEDKTTEDEGDPSGSDYNVGADTQPQGPMRVPVMQAPMLAAETEEYPPIGVYNNIGADEYHSGMRDNTYLPNMESVDKDNEFVFLPHQGPSAPENYVLWYENGVLHMNGYTGGRIETKTGLLQPKPLEILVEADSTIRGSRFGCIRLNSGKGKFHSLIISSPNGKKLTLNLDVPHGEIAAITSYSGNNTQSNVTLQGSVVVEATVNSTATTGRVTAFGIEARDVAILEKASFKAVCTAVAPLNDGCAACGIVANGKLTVNTTGTIDINVSDVSADGRAYSIGLRGSSVDFQRVTYMAVKWANGYPYAYGLAIYPEKTEIKNHAVCHPNQTDYTSAIYRYGVPRKVTLTDCDITSARDPLGRQLYTEGTFLFGDELTIEARNHGYPVMGWETNSITPNATTDPLKYQVHDDTENLTIKPLYRFGEEGGLSFEWTGSDTGQVRLKLFGVSNIPMEDIRLDVFGNANAAVVGEATYDYGNKMLLVPVGNLNTKSSYRLTVKNTSGTELYSEWFQPIPVDTPTIDKPSGYYYGSMNVNVTVPTSTEVFYKTSTAEIYSGSEGTAFSGDPIAVDGTNNSLTLRARKITNGVAIWSTPVTATWTKLDTLPTPIVRFYDGENEVMPDSNNTVQFHEKLTAVLSKPSPWPVNAEMGYSRLNYSGLEVYQTPVEYTAEGVLRVYTKATLADGSSTLSDPVLYTIQQHPSYVTKTLSVRKDSNIKVYDINNGLLTPSNPNAINHKYTLNVGRQFTVEAPLKSGDKVFKSWQVSNGVSVTFDNISSRKATFVMPNKDIQLAAYYDTPYDISGSTFLMLSPTEAAGINLKLRPNYSEWRSLSYQWYEGDTASGTPLNHFDSFETGKTYTAQVKVTATEGVIFTSSANIKVQRSGSNLEVANDRVERAADNSYLAFDLHLITKPELTIEPVSGDTLPTKEALTAQLPGFTVTPTWQDGATTAPSGATEVTIDKLEIRPVDGSYQLAGESVWINGTKRTGNYAGGTLTLTNITVPVKSKGVKVSGTAVSWNATDDALYYLYPSTTEVAAIKAEWKSGSYTGTACTSKGTPAASGKQFEQTFTFDTVAAGDYKLVIVKPGHGLWIEELTVNTDNITDKSIRLYKMGDVNRDGKVNGTDALWVRQSGAGSRTLDAYQKVLADLNRDGKVNGTDVLWIRQIGAGSRTLTY